MTDDDLKRRIRELRSINVSINDIRRQTGASEFDIHEVLEGYDIAVKKTVRKHFVRGNPYLWERSDNDPERPLKPSGEAAVDAARGVVSYMREFGDLDTVPADERRRVLDVVAEIVRMAEELGGN
jgi:hypothetical protein